MASVHPILTLSDNGGWCWFEDERAVIHNGVLYAGTVANGAGTGGAARDGNIELISHDLKSGDAHVAVLHEKLQPDDHDSPAIYIRQDGKILAMYGKHTSDDTCRWRITAAPNDATRWEPEQSLDVPKGRGYCYSNIYRLGSENNKLYNFFRGPGFNPNYLTSTDDGTTWQYGGRLLFSQVTENGKAIEARPYLRYTSNNTDTIHFIATEGHPRDIDNSIYHGFIRGGKVFRSDGTVVGDLSKTIDATIQPHDLTKVFQGDADNVAWTIAIRLDTKGHPYILFSVQKNDGDKKNNDHAGGEDLRYFYGRFDGTKWNVHEIAHAGSRLYTPEVDYTGLATLHPYNPDVAWISTNADPVTGTPLISSTDQNRHYEIFKGVTTDYGASWKWLPVTKDSILDNIRPIIPPGDPDTTVLLWLQGTYTTYTDYNLRVMMQRQ